MNTNCFDIHSHLYFPDFDGDRDEVIAQMKEQGIGTITIGTDFDSSETAIELAEKHDNVFACVGQHPGDVTPTSEYDKRLNPLMSHLKVVAIGECGLDYFRLPSDTTLVLHLKAVQKKIFESHIELAIQSNKPLMLHIRCSKSSEDAYEDALCILEEHAKIHGEKLRGNAHFFAGSLETLKRFLAIGFTVSFTGVLTFTHDYDELVRSAPLGMIQAETDAPFVAPAPFRGKRNSPLYVPEVVKAIARIRGEDENFVKQSLFNNAKRLFLSSFEH